MTDDERWMESAFLEAEQAFKRKEVPVGAIVMKDGKVIGRGYNQTETLKDPTAHAEMIAITAAAMHIGNHRLEGCTLYVTLEPCPMCAGAIVLARISRLVYGAPDPKAGACTTLYKITQDSRLNHQVDLTGGILEPRCSTILKDFFGKIRGKTMGKPEMN
ncbi:MAG: tRNA adenosine(34) deaminase TadA [Ignavibacteria bacterium]|nr:tRNA adenosine(34) deaminase TadA [Ignavibacteria bacterium]